MQQRQTLNITTDARVTGVKSYTTVSSLVFEMYEITFSIYIIYGSYIMDILLSAARIARPFSYGLCAPLFAYKLVTYSLHSWVTRMLSHAGQFVCSE